MLSKRSTRDLPRCLREATAGVRHLLWHDHRVTDNRSERLAHAIKVREAGQLEEARELFLALRQEFPADAQIAVQTAWVHDSLGWEEEAVPHYRAAIDGDLSDEELRGALLGLGSTLRTLGRDDEAADVFRRGLERFPDYRPLRVFNAMLRYNTGDAREAVADLLRLLVESTADDDILRYRRAVTAYAEDLDRSWLV
jgi:tetratricopeptide (TPR) repeat protein